MTKMSDNFLNTTSDWKVFFYKFYKLEIDL